MYLFKNFKNFSDAKINLFESVTLMIGKNGAGKSNAIEAIELLSQIAHGRYLHEIVDIGRANAGMFEIRGGLTGCLSNRDASGELPSDEFQLGFSAAFKFDGNEQALNYSVAIGVTGDGLHEARIRAEKLIIGDRVIFDASIGRSTDILNVTYDNFQRGPNKPVVQLSSDRSVLSRYETFIDPANKNQKQKDAKQMVRSLEQHLNSAFVFDPNPRVMREYERMGQANLQKNGANLSSVLHSLKSGQQDNLQKLERILNLIKQLPEEPFKEFDFIETRARDVLLALKREDDSITDARSLSDGTLRALAILTALETVPENSRIVIEEIDNGIHPSRIKILIDTVWECSQRRKLNILVTTHNPATLNSLDAMQLKAVVLCYTDPTSKSSKLIQLVDLPRVESLLEQSHLGDLVTRQVLEKHLLQGFDENQKSKALSWLESLS